jgi:hypothetical protein
MPGADAVLRVEAPGSSGYPGGMRAPGRSPSPWPSVSDYTVEPESGQEMFDGEVREASPAGAKHSWRTYGDDEVIADPCLFEPVPVRARLDAVEADDAVAQALLDKGNPVLVAYGDRRYRAGEEKGEERGKAEGEVKAAREHICMFMQARGVAMDAAAHARIAACSDLAALKRWLMRAPYATSASELFGD